jgi:Holliday junction resolvase-like predicted endonuclease
MTRRAARVDGNHAQIVAELRAAGCHVEDLSAVGRGVPDLVVASPSGARMVFVEVKTRRGKLREQQVAWFAKWPADLRMVARTAEEVLERLEML